MHLFQSFINSVIKYKGIYSSIILITTIIAAYFTVKNLSVDNSLSIWFLEDNTDYKEYISYQKEQGSDEIIIALVPVEDGLSEDSISILNSLHQKIDTLPYVNATFSLANAQYPKYFNKNLSYKPVYNPRRNKAGTESLLDKMPVIKEQLITKDGKNLLFYTQLKSSTAIEAIRKEAVKNIENIIQKNTKTTAIISGAPILNEAYNETVYNETIFFAILTIVVILLALLLLFSKPFYILAALLSVIIPISFLFGLMSVLGYQLNLILMLIPTVLMVYCLSDAIHIISIFDNYVAKYPNENRKTQLINALQKSLKPCFFTTVTTLVGYFALYLSPLPAFKSMGIFASVGLLLSFVLVYIIITIVFSFENAFILQKNKIFVFLKGINLQPILHSLNSFTSTYTKLLLVLFIIIFGVGIVAITKIEVNTDPLNLLGEGTVKDDLYTIENTLQGSTRLQLNVISTDGTSLLNNEAIGNLTTFQDKLKENKLVSSPVSLVNIQSFLQKRTPLLFQVSLPKNLGKQLSENTTKSNRFFSLFSDDFSSLGISVNIKELKTKELEQLIKRIKEDFETSFATTNYNLKIQGFSYVYAKLNTFILETQFKSFSMAFLVSFLVLFIFIKNVKITLLALIPNLLPLAILAIVMVIFEIPLDVSSAMIAPIMLGISMDDTIHFIYNFKKSNAFENAEESVNKATIHTGKALVTTTLILTFGFLILCFSEVQSIRDFGLLCAFTMCAALLSDLVFLPVLLKLFGK